MEEKGILLCLIEHQTRTENLQEYGDKSDNKRELKADLIKRTNVVIYPILTLNCTCKVKYLDFKDLNSYFF